MRVQYLTSHTLIFRTHSSSRYSVAALVGALELDERLVDLSIQAPLDLALESIQKSIDKGPTIIAHSVMSTQTDRVYREVKELSEDMLAIIDKAGLYVDEEIHDIGVSHTLYKCKIKA